MQEVGINNYKLSKTCHHTQIDSFFISWECAQSKEAIQDHWLVDYSTVSAFGAYDIVTKMQAVQVGTLEQSIRRARGQARIWIVLYSLHHRIRAIVQTDDSHVPYQRNYCHIVSLVTYPMIYPNVDILIWSYPWAGYKYATFWLLFAVILLYIISKKYYSCQMIYESHKTALLLHLFLSES